MPAKKRRAVPGPGRPEQFANSRTITVLLDGTTHRHIRMLAARDGCHISDIVRGLIAGHLKKHPIKVT